MNNNTQESKIQLEYINKCTELVKEKYKKAPAFFIQNAGCQMNSLQTDTVAGIVKRMGYTEVSREEDNRVKLFCLTAESPEEIDIRRAQEAKERAEEQMRQKQSIQEYHMNQLALSRAMARLRVTSHKEI